MGAFTHTGTAMEWRGAHETVRIEPWGRNSLRVRGTTAPAPLDTIPVYLRAGGSVKPFGPVGSLGPENSGE